MTKEDLLRLSQAVDYALAQSQESVNTRLASLARTAYSADAQTAQALNELVTIAASNPNR